MLRGMMNLNQTRISHVALIVILISILVIIGITTVKTTISSVPDVIGYSFDQGSSESFQSQYDKDKVEFLNSRIQESKTKPPILQDVCTCAARIKKQS